MRPPGPSLHAYVDEQLECAIRSLDRRRDRVHEGVHEARRSMRRVRACLALATFDRSAAGKPIDRALAEICRGLSSLRDARARVESVDRLLDASELDDRASLFRRIRRFLVRESAVALSTALRDDVGFTRHRARLAELRRRIAALPWEEVERAMIESSSSRSRKRARAARARALAGGDAEDWHRWRRRVRRVEQQSAALAACHVTVASRYAPLRHLARRLGRIQDLTILVDRLRALPMKSDEERGRLVESLGRQLDVERSRVEVRVRQRVPDRSTG